jgi:hypothetical protein
MSDLLYTQAYLRGAAVEKVYVNAELKAPDEGCDGWSPKPPTPDPWLGDKDTCWQLKARGNGVPSKLPGEVDKPGPKKALAEGKRFVVVTSGSQSGETGERERRVALQTRAKKRALPTKSIDVIGSERLTAWVNEHPAIAARWAGRPEALWLFKEWDASQSHKGTWHGTPERDSEIATRRAELDLRTGALRHYHIYGAPGVGKTRFALELCRGAAWRNSVVYIPQAADLRLVQLIDSVAGDAGSGVVIVVDEVQSEQLRALRQAVDRGNGRIRLITIGTARAPDPSLTQEFRVEPLSDQQMRAAIAGWHPSMPFEHVEFVVNFADGYLRLAQLVANAVAREPTLDVGQLLDQGHIRDWLDRLIGSAQSREALFVVAALSRVGWKEELAEEGKAIAQHLGMDWSEVRLAVFELHKRLQIAPPGGRYRYISPAPLGVYLALDAWSVFPEEMSSLPEALPTPGAREAYFERLRMIGTVPAARAVARKELSSFTGFEDFLAAPTARRWALLASADPGPSAKFIADVLAARTVDDRGSLAGNARREVVNALARLAGTREAFRSTVLALVSLAEAENETYANNASGELLACFKLVLSGSPLPYSDRLLVLDEVIARKQPGLTVLAIRALAQIGERFHSGRADGGFNPALPEPQWFPRTADEYIDSVSAALRRLSDLATQGDPAVRDELLKAVTDLTHLLADRETRPHVRALYDSLLLGYPELRGSLRRSLLDYLAFDRKHRKELGPEDFRELEEFSANFADHSLSGRMREALGVYSEPGEGSDLSSLAAELLKSPEVLEQEWAWLTSGAANLAWYLGEALAAADTGDSLAPRLAASSGQGPDLRLPAGYVCAKRKLRGDEWFEAWVATEAARTPPNVELLIELTRRCGATESTARRVAELLQAHPVDPHNALQLGYGIWHQSLSKETLRKVLEGLVRLNLYDPVMAILDDRLERLADELTWWEGFLVPLVTRPALVRAKSTMLAYHWARVAERLVPKHAAEIGVAILREQADRESGTWFANFSEAGEVLKNCVKHDPEGIWPAMAKYLEPPGGYSFIVGLSTSLLERMPRDAVLTWVAEEPKRRAAVVAESVGANLSTDDGLAALILATYGDDEDVRSAFFSAYITGSWVGPASAHWESLATRAEQIAQNTQKPKLREWALDTARRLRDTAERDRQREEEERVRLESR